MIRQVKHIIKVILIFALVMCWGITLGYANNIERDNDAINFYFENGNINADIVKNIEESKSDISVGCSLKIIPILFIIFSIVETPILSTDIFNVPFPSCTCKSQNRYTI